MGVATQELHPSLIHYATVAQNVSGYCITLTVTLAVVLVDAVACFNLIGQSCLILILVSESKPDSFIEHRSMFVCVTCNFS